jgi:hypothetical protein
VFRGLWRDIGANVGAGVYRCIPRIVGETGGKNWHLVHGSAEVRNAVVQAVRGAFEYQGECFFFFFFFFDFGFLNLDVKVRNVRLFRGFMLLGRFGRVGLKNSCWSKLQRSRLGLVRIGLISWVQ